MTWAEDRATVGTDPSADPGAKTGDGANLLRPTPFAFPLRDWHHAKNPTKQRSGHVATHQSELTNNDGTKLHFTLNQNKTSSIAVVKY